MSDLQRIENDIRDAYETLRHEESKLNDMVINNHHIQDIEIQTSYVDAISNHIEHLEYSKFEMIKGDIPAVDDAI